MSKIAISKGIVVLFATAGAGILATWFIQQRETTHAGPVKHELTINQTGSGSSGSEDSGCYPRCPTLNPGNSSAPPPSLVSSPLKITSKPRAEYTDEARTDDVQGTDRLKIELMADGHIGNITPLNQLPDGLTEQAIAAARRIKFEPRKVNGIPQSSVLTFEYSFTIY